MDFQRYGDWSPTAFDSNIDIDRGNWLVMPVMQTRDSGPLDQSNFTIFLKELGGESETVEVHRFGHWGPGWFEIIIVDPSDETARDAAYDCARALENYPVLDDSDLSERENAAEIESWENWASRDFSRVCEGTLEAYGDEFHGEPVDPHQRWCKNWNMDVELCSCGDCILTADEWAAELIAKLDNLDNVKLYELAVEMDLTVEHHSDGPYFKYKVELQKLCTWLDELNSTVGPG